MQDKLTPVVKRINKMLTQFNACIPLLITLGDSTRQKLYLDIAQAGKEGLNVASITDKSKLSRPAISYHLKMMKDCGLIKANKQGTQIFYSVTYSKKFMAFREVMHNIEEIMLQAEQGSTTEA